MRAAGDRRNGCPTEWSRTYASRAFRPVAAGVELGKDPAFPDVIDDAARALRRSRAPAWLVFVAKFGYVARGLLYLIVGGLALLRALGLGGATADSRDALIHLLGSPAGTATLWLLAAGLIGYAIWRMCQAILDVDRRGAGWRAAGLRAGFFVSALSHTGLAIFAAYLASHPFDSGGDAGQSAKAFAATALGWPGGPWWIIAGGCGVAAAGVAHLLASLGRRYSDRFVVSPAAHRWLAPICKFGLVSRGLALILVGALLAWAGLTHDPSEAGGLREVLQHLARQRFGMVLLGTMGCGLMAFGLYSVFEGWFRRVDGPPMAEAS